MAQMATRRAFSSAAATAKPLNKYSRTITEPRSQGASQAMLYAAGLTTADLRKPQIGIASVWYEGNPCNMHLLDLSADVKASVQSAGLVGLRFNTVGVSDGISMGTRGMSYSLPSREIIADSVETVMRAQWYDGCVSIAGCDKNMPGVVMGMTRVNRPSLMVYGGTIRAGCSRRGSGGPPLDIVSAFQAYGEYIAGRIDDDARQDVIEHACPGPGACGGMYTANTMATAIEAMGLALPYSSSSPATSGAKRAECVAGVGTAMRRLLEEDLKPRDILTRDAFHNGLVTVMALGGSTNAVIHLVAMARAAGVELTLDDIQAVSDAVPFIANLKPSGEYVMEDVALIGGTPAVLKYLLSKGLLRGHCMTATCQSLADTLRPLPGVPGMTGEDETSAARRIVMPTPGAAAPAAVSSAAARSPTDATPSSPPPPPPSTGAAGLTPPELARRLLRPIENPLKPSGHITIMRGNVAPGGAVAKITGKEGLSFTGRVCVYEGEGAMLKSLERGELHARLGITRPAGRPQANAAATLAEAAAAATAAAATAAAGVWSSLGPVTRLVVVIRGEGPVGGPGMLEMLTPTSAIMGAGLGLQVAMLTDGRFSGGSHGFIVGHIVPEAALGGPVGLLVDGDLVEIDATTRTINAVNISEEEWARRRAAWTPPQPKEVALSGTLRKYVQLVRSASEGCVTDA